MRREPGDLVRLFNGRDGEWLGEIEALGKKDGRVLPLEQVKVQPVKAPEVHLIFTPLQKNRLDFLVEKAAELGATALHPVLTARTEHRKINEERAGLQLIEASEQCERLDIPVLHPLEDLKAKMVKWSVDTPVFWGAERRPETPTLAQALSGYEGALAFLIGPAGGFTPEEFDFLSGLQCVRPVSLGERLLRAETAGLACLSHVLDRGNPL